MSKAHRKYLREDKAGKDKQQTHFNIEGGLRLAQVQEAKIKYEMPASMQVMCPYCLYTNKLSLFLKSTKKGIHRSQALCPDCKNGMLICTLTQEMTPEQYAEWMFNNMGYGGWQKVPFNKWKERLAQIGWARQFWDKYKALKAEYIEQPTYEDILNQQYQEWLKEHGEEE